MNATIKKSKIFLKTSEICTQIEKNRNCIGLIKEKITALATSVKDFNHPEIITAITKTKYYKQIGQITPEILKEIPDSEKKPIHILFASYFSTTQIP